MKRWAGHTRLRAGWLDGRLANHALRQPLCATRPPTPLLTHIRVPIHAPTTHLRLSVDAFQPVVDMLAQHASVHKQGGPHLQHHWVGGQESPRHLAPRLQCQDARGGGGVGRVLVVAGAAVVQVVLLLAQQLAQARGSCLAAALGLESCLQGVAVQPVGKAATGPEGRGMGAGMGQRRAGELCALQTVLRAGRPAQCTAHWQAACRGRTPTLHSQPPTCACRGA